jgi:YVTN family beta-propeller protein
VGSTVEFRVLGPVEAIAEGVRLDLGGPKQRAVLTLLLLHANEVVLHDRLVDELWGEAPPPAARETIKVYVGRLRKLLSDDRSSPRPVTGGGYILELDSEQLDLDRFQRLAESGSRALAGGDAEAAAALLRKALGLWHGPPLANLGDAAFAPAEQARLEELRLVAVEDRIDADLALGRASDIVPELRQLTREHPYREPLHRRLMLALYRSGRQPEALAVYRDLRRQLVTEFGLEPSLQTRELERSILTLDAIPAARPRLPDDGRAAASHRTLAEKRRRRTRVPRLGIAVSLALVAAGIVAIGVAVHSSSHRADAIGRLVGHIPVPLPGGPFVGRLAVGAGSLWIRKSGDDRVLRVDPATNRIVARIRVGFAYDTDITVQGRDVWVTNGEDGTVSRIDAATNEVVATIHVGGFPLGIVATPNAIWVANHHSGTVSRIDPRRNTVVKTVPISLPSDFSGPIGVVFADHELWVSDATDGAVVRVDPLRNSRAGAILQSGPACGGMTADESAVWIASGCDEDTITRIDTRAARVAAVIHLPGVASDVASGFGSIWASTTNGSLIRIDPKTNRIIAKRNLGDAVILTTGGGDLWAINRITRSVVRIQPSA